MIETIILVGAILAAVYILAAAADIVLGQPRTGTGQFAPKRTTAVETGVKIGCLAALGILLFMVL